MPRAATRAARRVRSALLALGMVAVALPDVLWSEWLFHRRGQRGVAAVTRDAMALEPVTALDAGATRELWRCRRAVARWRRLWPHPIRCLQSSLVLQRMLRRRGIDTALRVGVRMEGADLHSHAWLEAGGHPIDFDHTHLLFQPLDPSSPALERALQ